MSERIDSFPETPDSKRPIIPTDSDAIRFLYQVCGYDRLNDFVRRLKPKGLSLRDFFDGTILATYRNYAVDEATGERVRVLWPRPSKVYSTETVDSARKCRSELPFNIYNLTWFQNFSGDQVMEFFNQHMEAFPNATFTYKPAVSRGRFWNYVIESSDMYFAVVGSSSHNSKQTFLDFQAQSEEVDRLNMIVSKYYGLIRHISERAKT